MNREHYAHVSHQFKLDTYHYCNRPENWSEDYEGLLETFTVREQDTRYGGWDIVDSFDILFSNLPSKEFAEEVLKYIEETRVIFA